MPVFGRSQRTKSRLVVSQSALGRLGDRQVTARLRVIAVTPPGRRQPVESALISGLLLGPFPLEVVQLTQALARDSWPVAGQELPAVADPENPLIFSILWGEVQGADAALPAGWQDTSDWDAGPGGTHQQAVVGYLAAAGFFAEDFGPGLDTRAPGMYAQLESACAKYVTVVSGQLAVSLAYTGEPAQGVVVQARKLPLPVQMMPSPDACLAWVTFEVTPPEGDTYRTTIRCGFRSEDRFAALATPGTHIPLRLNPDDRAQVTIDRPALGYTPL